MVDGRSGIDRWSSVLGRRWSGRAVIGLDILMEVCVRDGNSKEIVRAKVESKLLGCKLVGFRKWCGF